MNHMKILVNRAIDHGEYRELAYELAQRLWDAGTGYDMARGGLPTVGEVGLHCVDMEGNHLDSTFIVPGIDTFKKLVVAMLEDVDTVFSEPGDMHYIWVVTSDDEPGTCYAADTQACARRYVEKLVLGDNGMPETGMAWQHLGDDMLRLNQYIVHRTIVSYGIL